MTDGAASFMLDDAQRLDWLQLIRSDNVGPRTFRALVNRYGGAAAALEALPGLIRSHGGSRQIRIASRDDCAREMERCARLGARFVALGEDGYPSALRMIDSPPPLIAIKGKLAAASMPAVAIVGSRNASAAGLSLTTQITHDLAREGYAIVSGLARGIDQQAHRASLQTGTMAVLAGGLDKIYPPEHEALAQAICEHGLLISEMPFGWVPRGRDFPRRNRLVSGIALGTVVIEAARRSGSLITARFANEQGREVFAVPGSPLDPRAEGSNDLLRQGATLCTRGEDVIEALSPLHERGGVSRLQLLEPAASAPDAEPLWDESDLFDSGHAPHSMPGLDLNEDSAANLVPAGDEIPVSGASLANRISGLLGPAPVPLDDLIRNSGVSAAEVQLALVELELAGEALRHPGGFVSRI